MRAGDRRHEHSTEDRRPRTDKCETRFLVLGILGILVLVIVATVVFVAIYARDTVRRKDAQTVLRTLFGK